MPEIRDITVRVTSSSGEDLKEWGVQAMRKHNRTSCYIQAETDMAFRVSIQPKIPYVSADTAAAHVYGTRRRGSTRPGFFDMEDEWEEYESDDLPLSDSEYYSKPLSNRRSSPGRKHSKSEPRGQARTSTSSIATRNFKKVPAPEFHLLASLYIDGRSKPERRVVVYLDPEDDDFNAPEGKVSFKSRWVQGRDGRLQEHTWLFKDVGIETVFDKMLISGKRSASDTIYKRDEEDLIAAMNCTDIEGEGIDKNQKVKAGQIVVTLQRIKLGEKWEDRHYRAGHKEGEGEDVDMEGAEKDVTHTTGFGRARPIGSNSVRVVAYTPYNEIEGIYASFQFFYRSEGILQRFNFIDFPKPQVSTPAAGAARTRRQLNSQLANLTPLSISNPLKPSPKTLKSKPTVFEDRVKKGLGFDDTTPYTSKGAYRDPNSEENVSVKKEKKEEQASQCQNLLSIAPFAHTLQSALQAASQQASTQSSHRRNSSLEGLGLISSTSDEETDAAPVTQPPQVTPETQNALRQQLLAAGLSIPSAGLYPQNDGSYPPSLASTPKASSARDGTPDTDTSVNAIKGTPPAKSKARASSIKIPKTTLPPIASSPFPAKPSKSKPIKLSVSGGYRSEVSEADADDEYESDRITHHGSNLEKTDSASEPDLANEEPHDVDNDDGGLYCQLGDLDIRKRGRDDEDEHEVKDQSGKQAHEGERPPAIAVNEKGELELKPPVEDGEKELSGTEEKDEKVGARAKRRKVSEERLCCNSDEGTYLGRDGH
ncbi:MAG: hypothetical protein M1835_000207 [Candelina submexicana]|nr:MAG: hypothetical protein M1835_000207 [Candelina submexicana]